MVTLNVMNSKWRASYVPQEGTGMDVQEYLEGSPCLVVITAYSYEDGHDTVQRWVVPSEFMPKLQLGNMKTGTKGKFRTELLLENKMSIGRWVTREHELHETLFGFSTTNPTAAIGSGKVPVNPAPYLRQVGEYKRIAEYEFDRIVSGVRKPWGSTAVGRDGDEHEDEDENMEKA